MKVIQPSELNWFRLLKNDTLSDFDRERYDTLLDLSKQSKHLLQLLIRNKSRFCIGLTRRKYKLYDFILLKNEEQSLNDAYVELKKYLKSMQ
jgi:hypothetical protein